MDTKLINLFNLKSTLINFNNKIIKKGLKRQTNQNALLADIKINIVQINNTKIRKFFLVKIVFNFDGINNIVKTNT